MYTLEGVSSIANFITAYEITYSHISWAGFGNLLDYFTSLQLVFSAVWRP